jgi:Xaa-Pro aminopeptidase
MDGDRRDYTFEELRRRSDALAAHLRDAGVTRVAVEGEELTVSAFNKLEEIDGVEWTVLEKTVEPLRAIKADVELAQIRAAAKITDHAMTKVPYFAATGQTERELAWQLEKEMRESGADGIAFPVHVASGPNAALPHHLPGNRRLREGDSLIVDIGAKTGGYCSDLTRTFYLGSQPSEQFQKVYTTVLEAHTAALDAVRPGVTGQDVDAVARNLIADAGHGEHFGHGLGHGVGLVAHEDPRLTRNSSQVLAPGMVTTVEPGIYLPNWGGVRIEDLVLVTENGVEFLSRCPKEPTITGL